ncbi:MAG: ABC transporter ATP-binding protein [Thermoprotei archaeon]
MSDEPLLVVEHVVKRFPVGGVGFFDRIMRRKRRWLTAVDDVSFSVGRGETLALLGESGSGKTTLGRLIVGLEKPDSGRIVLEGSEVKSVRESREQRGKLQMVFQDPSSSLDPYLPLWDCVAEPLSVMGLDKQEVRARVEEALRLVGLDSTLMRRGSSELSGGQKQRVAIARAIVSEPKVVVLDEPTTSIDVTLQAQILNLLVDLQKLKGYTYILITHDPAVARFLADRVAVIYLGKVVEIGSTKSVLFSPKHPYTKALLESTPKIGGGPPKPVRGEPPSLINPPRGCRYEPRCPYAFEACRLNHPHLVRIADTDVACYLFVEQKEEVGDGRR